MSSTAGFDAQFFVFDHTFLKKEEDDLKDAIVYFYPSSVNAEQQCALCGQLMGMVEYFRRNFDSPPSMYKLARTKVAVKHVGNFTLAYCGNLNFPDQLLLQQTHKLYDVFAFYFGSLDLFYEICEFNRDVFVSKMQAVWETFVSFTSCYGQTTAETFHDIPHLTLPKHSSTIFITASKLLSGCQRTPGVLAGCILHKQRVLCTQLSPELTSRLLLIRAQQRNLPCIPLETAFSLPRGVRVLRVYLSQSEYDYLDTCSNKSGNRHYKTSQYRADKNKAPGSTSAVSFSVTRNSAEWSERSYSEFEHETETWSGDAAISSRSDQSDKDTSFSGEETTSELPGSSDFISNNGNVAQDENSVTKLADPKNTYGKIANESGYEHKSSPCEEKKDSDYSRPQEKLCNASALQTLEETVHKLGLPSTNGDLCDVKPAQPTVKAGTDEHSPDGLQSVSLYIQGNSDMVLLLLMTDNGVSQKTIKSLWQYTIQQLADLDFELNSGHTKCNRLATLSSVSYLTYDTYLKCLSGNTLDPVSNLENEFCDMTRKIHSDFQQYHSLRDMTLRSHTNCASGHRETTQETYVKLHETHELATMASPCDLLMSTDSKAKSLLVRAHRRNIIL